jgi:hypothetical protein
MAKKAQAEKPAVELITYVTGPREITDFDYFGIFVS